MIVILIYPGKKRTDTGSSPEVSSDIPILYTNLLEIAKDTSYNSVNSSEKSENGSPSGLAVKENGCFVSGWMPSKR